MFGWPLLECFDLCRVRLCQCQIMYAWIYACLPNPKSQSSGRVQLVQYVKHECIKDAILHKPQGNILGIWRLWPLNCFLIECAKHIPWLKCSYVHIWYFPYLQGLCISFLFGNICLSFGIQKVRSAHTRSLVMVLARFFAKSSGLAIIIKKNTKQACILTRYKMVQVAYQQSHIHTYIHTSEPYSPGCASSHPTRFAPCPTCLGTLQPAVWASLSQVPGHLRGRAETPLSPVCAHMLRFMCKWMYFSIAQYIIVIADYYWPRSSVVMWLESALFHALFQIYY
jgi:hypothetical protein